MKSALIRREDASGSKPELDAKAYSTAPCETSVELKTKGRIYLAYQLWNYSMSGISSRHQEPTCFTDRSIVCVTLTTQIDDNKHRLGP